jgi:hypothetical protein
MSNFKHIGCVVNDCERKHKARGLCSPHYMEAMRNFEFSPKPWVKPMEERKRPRRNPVSGEVVESLPDVDADGFWDFVKKEMQL